MKPWLAIAATLIVAGCASPPGTGAPSSGGALPELSAGDHWHYAVVTKNPMYADIRDDLTETFVRHTSYGGQPARYVESEARRDPGNGQAVEIHRKIWTRSSDGALLEENATVAGDSQVIRWQPPCRQIQWPLVAGSSWSQACDAQRNFMPPLRLTFAFKVSGPEEVIVPAGTFMAFRVNGTATLDGGDVLEYSMWYAADACGLVKKVQRSGQGVSTTELLDYGCRASA